MTLSPEAQKIADSPAGSVIYKSAFLDGIVHHDMSTGMTIHQAAAIAIMARIVEPFDDYDADADVAIEAADAFCEQYAKALAKRTAK